MELEHRRRSLASSRDASISVMSDDDMGLSREGSKHARTISTGPVSPLPPEHVQSPPLPEDERTPSMTSYLKPAGTGRQSEGGDFPDLPPRKPRSRGPTTMSMAGFRRPGWLAWFRQKYWAYDGFGIVGGVLFFLVLVALLAGFEGRNYTDWSFGVTLNAMVSLLVTLMGLCLTIPVATCLGQLKWNHYRRHGGKLRTFDLHDQASRSVWGSLKLIGKRPTHFHGLLAAFIMIAIQTIAPFVQQIIRLGTVETGFNSPTVPVAYSYVESGDSDQPVDQLTQFSIYQSLYTLQPGVFPVYPHELFVTDNSTYPLYASLGTNSECVDVTGALTKNEIVTQAVSDSYFKVSSFDLELSNGHAWSYSQNRNGDHEQLQIFSISADYDSIAFKDRGNVLVDFTSIYLPPASQNSTGDVKPIAWECMIQFAGWPLASYSVAGTADPGPFIEYFSHDGKPVVDNTQTAQANSPWHSYLKWKASGGQGQSPSQASNAAPTCVNVTVPTHDDQSQNIGTCFTGVSRLAKFLGTAFSGRVTATASRNRILFNITDSSGQSDYITSMASVVGGPPETALPGFDLPWMVNGTAMSLANNMRTASPDVDRQGIPGKAYHTQLVYQIEWGWAAVPVLLIILTTALLIWTMIDTKRKSLPVWGTSSLADLLHGLDDHTRSTLIGITEVEELEHESERIHVFLRPAEKILSAIATGPLSGSAESFADANDDSRPTSFRFSRRHEYERV